MDDIPIPCLVMDGLGREKRKGKGRRARHKFPSTLQDFQEEERRGEDGAEIDAGHEPWDTRHGHLHPYKAVGIANQIVRVCCSP